MRDSSRVLQPLQLPVAGLNRRAHEDAAGHDLLGNAVVEDPRSIRLQEVEVLDLVDAGVDGAVDRLGGQAMRRRLLPHLMRFVDRGSSAPRRCTRRTTNRSIHPPLAMILMKSAPSLRSLARGRAHPIDAVRLFVAPPEMPASNRQRAPTEVHARGQKQLRAPPLRAGRR